MSERSKARLRYVVGFALIALGLWLVWRVRSRTPAEPIARAEEPSQQPADESSVARRAPPPQVVDGGITLQRGPSVDRLEQNLLQYKKVSAYPPWSRAYDDGT